MPPVPVVFVPLGSQVIRTIADFHVDDAGDWVAELDCGHGQHVRHRPPFQNRAWVLSAASRHSRVGSKLDCPLCDRCEMPTGLVLLRTAGPFDAASLPEGLKRPHRTAKGVWAVLRVLEGRVDITVEVAPRLERELAAGDHQTLPPSVVHVLVLHEPARVSVEFWGHGGPATPPLAR